MIKVSVVLFAVDALVILASALVFDATAAMFALIASFLMSKMVDVVLEGMNAAKAYFYHLGKVRGDRPADYGRAGARGYGPGWPGHVLRGGQACAALRH